MTDVMKKMLTKKISVLSLLLFTAVVVVSAFNKEPDKVSTYLPIENIKIEGEFANLKQSDIKKTVKNVMQGGYFTVDIEAIRHALINLPWVDNVSVRRHWPAGLTIVVTEKRAIAYWGKNKLLSDKGELFSPATISHSGVSGEPTMPQLDGPDGLHKTMWVFLTATNKNIKDLGVVVTHLILDKRRSWEMRLSNNVVVKLGGNDVENRLQRFIKVFSLDSAPKMQNIESMDLRYPNGLAVQMKTAQSDLYKFSLVKEV